MNREELFKLITCSNEDSVKIIQDIANKYSCSIEKVYWNVRSVFGKKLRDLRWDFREPSREGFLKSILMVEDAKQLRNKYSEMSESQWKGVYDRLLGVSTFKRAKEVALLELLPIVYTPTTDNNMAMWVACRLGDGSYDKRRRSWKIEHCSDQVGWLEKKVSIFNKAFPRSSSTIKYNKKRDTYSWYSRAIASGKFQESGESPKISGIPHLNLFGLWWLFLDDGCYYRGSQQKVSYAVENTEIGVALCEHLNKMGYKFRVANKNEVCMTGIENIIPFFKEVLEPFEKQTPDCMMYKIKYVKI